MTALILQQLTCVVFHDKLYPQSGTRICRKKAIP